MWCSLYHSSEWWVYLSTATLMGGISTGRYPLNTSTQACTGMTSVDPSTPFGGLEWWFVGVALSTSQCSKTSQKYIAPLSQPGTESLHFTTLYFTYCITYVPMNNEQPWYNKSKERCWHIWLMQFSIVDCIKIKHCKDREDVKAPSTTKGGYQDRGK